MRVGLPLALILLHYYFHGAAVAAAARSPAPSAAPTPTFIGPDSLCYELCARYPRKKPCPAKKPNCPCRTPAARYCFCAGNTADSSCRVVAAPAPPG